MQVWEGPFFVGKELAFSSLELSYTKMLPIKEEHFFVMVV